MTGDLDLVRRLVTAERGLAVVATTRADGSVHASLVNAGVLTDPESGEEVVGLVIRGSAAKARLIRTRGHAAVTFRSGWQWATVDGPARLVGPDDPHVPDTDVPKLLRDVFVAAAGTHDDWAEYDRVMAAERRLAVLIRPTRIISNG